MSTLCDLWNATVERFPTHIALHHRDHDWTYATLDDRVRRFAGWLLASGFQRGDRLVLLVPNSVEYVVGYFAALLAGGTAVGLNPEAMPREQAHFVEHCDARAVVATPAVLARFGEVAFPERPLLLVTGNAPVAGSLRQHGFEEVLANGQVAGELPAVTDAEVAQIIYTSGTTGRPKGVTLTHRNLFANCRSIVQYLALCDRDSVFVLLPFFYSYGNSLLMTHMAVGGRLILASDFVFWNRALDLMEKQRATGFSGVPSAYAMLLSRSDFDQRKFPDLRYLTCAGGALAQPLLTRIRTALPHVQFFPMYGQTEGAARLSVLMPSELDRRPGSIGKGIPGVELKVVDEHGQPVPPDTPGEIVARGENIMRGYWKDPELTATVLRADGLHTGDLARVDADGYIYIVGRKSDMIKTGAYRVAPLELEEILLELKGIAEAAVVGFPDEILGEVPVAYVVLNTNATPLTEGEILEHCARNLPRYKQIKAIRFVEELPKTQAGKIRRDALPRA